MPVGLTPARGIVVVNMAQFEMRNPYHSQGLAAGGSALLDAINRGKVHLAKFILDAGEYDVVNTRDFKGKTPLIRACYIKEEKTRDKAVQLLLAKEADVNKQDDSGRTALSYACELRANDVVRILVKNNVDPDVEDDKGNTPLTYGAMIGNDTAVEILVKSFRRLGLNVDHVNNEGLTALLIAAKNGFIECASLLAIEGKACISFRDRERGMNAEEWARAQGCSTPEILPFSPQAALLNYKYCHMNSIDRKRREDLEEEETSDSQKTDLDLSVTKRGQDKDGEEISFKIRAKRGSLPNMKFSNFLSHSRGSDLDSVPGKKQTSSKEDQATGQLYQSAESGVTRRRKSSKEHLGILYKNNKEKANPKSSAQAPKQTRRSSLPCETKSHANKVERSFTRGASTDGKSFAYSTVEATSPILEHYTSEGSANFDDLDPEADVRSKGNESEATEEFRLSDEEVPSSPRGQTATPK